ncbi:aminodeoxychorismate lyase [Pantoea sp. 1.19]|uniref:aminodeoxychorismate lyase n=1 Tax=Pantoea sp. 1.19 TaxID=1925589 RepID=UPI000948A610|nr:aminodeoxychorismate lyase [Pantoea sp. 1.19]
MIWVNGEPQAQIATGDRGLQFGDGCFTTARIRSGQVDHLEAHVARLQQACDRLMIAGLEVVALTQQMREAAQRQRDGVLKVIVTRGSGGRGYSAAGCRQPTTILSLSPAPLHYAAWQTRGVTLATSPVRLSRNSLLAGIKHLNRLEQVMIRAHLDGGDADEALVLDTDGWLVECCAANLFWRKGKQVYTPDLSLAGVTGLMREHILTLLPELGWQASSVLAPPEALAAADEVFICNALMPVLSVTRINQWHYASRELADQLRPHC